MSPTRAPHAHDLPDSLPPPGLTAEQTRQLALLPTIAETLDEVRELIRGRIKEHYTVDEFAALVGRAPYTVRAWITGNRLDAIRVEGTGPRGRLLIPRAEVDRLIARGKGADLPAISALPV